MAATCKAVYAAVGGAICALTWLESTCNTVTGTRSPEGRKNAVIPFLRAIKPTLRECGVHFAGSAGAAGVASPVAGEEEEEGEEDCAEAEVPTAGGAVSAANRVAAETANVLLVSAPAGLVSVRTCGCWRGRGRDAARKVSAEKDEVMLSA